MRRTKIGKKKKFQQKNLLFKLNDESHEMVCTT